LVLILSKRKQKQLKNKDHGKLNLKEHLTKYAEYNLWANKRLTAKLSEMKPEDWLLEQKSSFTTIRSTLLHIYDAETIWYKRLHGESLTEMPGNNFKGSNEEIIKMLTDISEAFSEFVKVSSEAFIDSNCTYKNLSGTEFTNRVSDIISHCMNHSTFHRGQLVTMIRFCGVTGLPSTDYIAFTREL
jgi:uncharacterized damage-inducible protein DinB